MKEILLEIQELTIGHGNDVLYDKVCLDICKGDCIMLCGANGSGKTTFLKQIARMGKDITMIPSRITKVPGFTLREFIRLTFSTGSRLTGAQEEAISESMERMELTALAEHDISTLSDGEFQKGCIAVALAKKASVILLDEPTAFLDAQNRVIVLQCLKEICSSDAGERPAVIFSTHDLNEGSKVCNKVIALGADGIFRCSTENISRTVSTIFK